MPAALSLDPIARSSWYPAALSLKTTAGPHPAVVLGEEIVLWRGSQKLHAWQDLCIHRGVRLSLGRITENNCALRCAYHGWTYGEDGQCAHMPAHPSLRPPSKARVKTYACEEHAGFAWVTLEDSKSAPPKLSEFHDPEFRAIPCGPYPSGASAPRLIENFLDVAHLPIVHEGFLGVSDQAEIAPYEVEFANGLPIARDIRLYQPNPEGLQRAGEVSYEYGVLAPFTVYLRKRMAGGHCFTLLFAVTPVTEVSSIAWFSVFMNYGDPSEDAGIVAFQDRIFAQDQPIVTSQRPERLPLDLAEELHLPSDRLAIAYRKYIRALGLTFGTA